MSSQKTSAPRGACHEPVQVLHRPADLRRRALRPDPAGRADLAPDSADLGISGGRAALDRGARAISRRQSARHRRDGGDADRGADQRRREYALHGEPGDDRRRDDADRHLQARHRRRQGPTARPEPRQSGRTAPARGGPPPRRDHGQELARPDAGRAHPLAQQPLRHDLSAQLRRPQRQGPAGADRRRRSGSALRLR